MKLDFSPAHKRTMLDSMIEQNLVQLELASSRYPLPDPAELAPAIDNSRKRTSKTKRHTSAALAALWHHRGGLQGAAIVAAHPATVHPGTIRDRRPGIAPQEVEQYFAKTVKPAAEAAHPGQPVSLDDYRDQIERKLTGQRADQQMDIWLRDVRKRTDVVVHQEALR